MIMVMMVMNVVVLNGLLGDDVDNGFSIGVGLEGPDQGFRGLWSVVHQYLGVGDSSGVCCGRVLVCFKLGNVDFSAPCALVGYCV